MGITKDQRLEAILAAVRAGVGSAKELINLPEYGGMSPTTRRTVLYTDLGTLVQGRRLWFNVGAGVGSPRTYFLPDNPPAPGPVPPPPAPAYVPPPPVPDPEPRDWTLEELLYWLASAEESPSSCLVARSFEAGRRRAVEAVRAAIDRRDARSEGQP